MTLIALAVLLAILWVIFFGAVHVTGWFIHVLLVAAVILAVLWLLDRIGSGV